jgi:hypothetical protein
VLAVDLPEISVRRRRQRWSIQVDQYPKPGEKMYGPRTVIESKLTERDYATNIGVPNTEVDEVIIDGWCHIENMNTNAYWMSIGGLHIDVTIDGKTGRAKKVIYRVEGEDGVEYVDDNPTRPL